MRIYLYLLAGITSALIGWNLGQFILADLGWLKTLPEIAIFPCIAISLAIGMVMNEIFISNPTRPKLSFITARIPILIAIGLGLTFGLISGIVSQVLFLPQLRFPSFITRIFAWVLIGSSVGIAEGLTWRWHSLEAGDKTRFKQRFKTSIIAASGASLAAALLFELIRAFLGRMPPAFKAAEDPIGFSLLGLLLGLAFSITNSPSYLAALRAGAGFEYQGEKVDPIEADSVSTKESQIPRINTLKFVSNSELKDIEEGLSIQLPNQGKVAIGSNEEAEIYIPDISPEAAILELRQRETILIPNPKFFKTIAINGEPLRSAQKVSLKHNYILTFYCLKQDGQNEEKIYRFVYYNRFLDPQA
jgi:hypothetical protein